MKHPSPAASFLAVVCLAAVSGNAVAQESPVIQAGDAEALKAAADTEVTVEGKVASAEWSRNGKVCNIKFEGEPTFIVAVFEKSRPKLDEAFGGDFAKQFTGATLRITGKLGAYGGRDPKYKEAMQVILSQSGQVTVMAAATQPTTGPSAQPAPSAP